MAGEKILIADNDAELCQLIEEILRERGIESDHAYSGASALSLMKRKMHPVVLLDIRLPDMDGLTLLKKLKEIKSDISAIVMTGYANVQLAVKSIQSGADDFIEKPMDVHRLIISINSILEKQKLRKEMTGLKREIEERYAIIGESAPAKRMRDIIENVAPSSSPVLVCGETGSGKELVARNIHMKSKRSNRPFMKINCAALPENLIESELFGYKKGAFTGAYESKAGIFETADEGSVFLDEIGDMSLSAQAKVLRVIESGEITKIGSVKEIKVDVRTICATNADLDQYAEEKRFRKDLLHRINVITINVPPLRDRKEDIPLLAEHFIRQFAQSGDSQEKKLTRSALSILMNYRWPGNIRELKHLMEKCNVLVKDTQITSDRLEELMLTGKKSGADEYASAENFRDAQRMFEREYILNALKANNWHIGKTAENLGIERSTLFRKMKNLSIKK